MLLLTDTAALRKIHTVPQCLAILDLHSLAPHDDFLTNHPLPGNQGSPGEIRAAIKTWLQSATSDLLPAEQAAFGRLCASYHQDTATIRATHAASLATFSDDFRTFVNATTAAPPPISPTLRAREALAASFPPRPYDRNADLVVVNSRRTRFQHLFQQPPVPLEFFPDAFLHALATINLSDDIATA